MSSNKQSADWEKFQIEKVIEWVNQMDLNKKVSNLATDFKDGVLLVVLLEKISKKELTGVNRDPKNNRIHMITNATKALNFMQDDLKIKLPGIGPEDIVDGKIKMILGTLWALLRYCGVAEDKTLANTAKSLQTDMNLWQKMRPKPVEVKYKNKKPGQEKKQKEVILEEVDDDADTESEGSEDEKEKKTKVKKEKKKKVVEKKTAPVKVENSKVLQKISQFNKEIDNQDVKSKSSSNLLANKESQPPKKVTIVTTPVKTTAPPTKTPAKTTTTTAKPTAVQTQNKPQPTTTQPPTKQPVQQKPVETKKEEKTQPVVSQPEQKPVEEKPVEEKPKEIVEPEPQVKPEEISVNETAPESHVTETEQEKVPEPEQETIKEQEQPEQPEQQPEPEVEQTQTEQVEQSEDVSQDQVQIQDRDLDQEKDQPIEETPQAEHEQTEVTHEEQEISQEQTEETETTTHANTLPHNIKRMESDYIEVEAVSSDDDDDDEDDDEDEEDDDDEQKVEQSKEEEDEVEDDSSPEFQDSGDEKEIEIPQENPEKFQENLTSELEKLESPRNDEEVTTQVVIGFEVDQKTLQENERLEKEKIKAEVEEKRLSQERIKLEEEANARRIMEEERKQEEEELARKELEIQQRFELQQKQEHERQQQKQEDEVKENKEEENVVQSKIENTVANDSISIAKSDDEEDKEKEPEKEPEEKPTTATEETKTETTEDAKPLSDEEEKKRLLEEKKKQYEEEAQQLKLERERKKAESQTNNNNTDAGKNDNEKKEPSKPTATSSTSATTPVSTVSSTASTDSKPDMNAIMNSQLGQVPGTINLPHSPYLFYTDPRTGKAMKYKIQLETTNIGRKKENDVELVSKFISRFHCRIDAINNPDGTQEKVLRFKDLDSSSGSTVNGDRVSEHILVKGDQIKIGKTVILFLDKSDKTYLSKPRKEGVGQKQSGSLLKNWQNRYFVIQGHVLYYFKSQKERKENALPNGMIDIDGCEIMKEDKLTFSVAAGKKKDYILKFATSQLKDEWLNLIKRISVRKR